MKCTIPCPFQTRIRISHAPFADLKSFDGLDCLLINHRRLNLVPRKWPSTHIRARWLISASLRFPHPPFHQMSSPLARLRPQDRPSVFEDKYNIPIMSTDIMLWDKAWEKALRTHSPAEEMYPRLSCMWDQDFGQGRDMNMENVPIEMAKKACGVQLLHADLLDVMNQEEFLVTTWMLLEEHERRRHLLSGMKAACDFTHFCLDARALCPEITTTAMLKRRGMAFIDLVRNVANGIRESGPDEVYLPPSEWFRSAVKEPQPWSDKTKFIFGQLGIQRAQFICE